MQPCTPPMSRQQLGPWHLYHADGRPQPHPLASRVPALWAALALWPPCSTMSHLFTHPHFASKFLVRSRGGCSTLPFGSWLCMPILLRTHTYEPLAIQEPAGFISTHDRRAATRRLCSTDGQSHRGEHSSGQAGTERQGSGAKTAPVHDADSAGHPVSHKRRDLAHSAWARGLYSCRKRVPSMAGVPFCMKGQRCTAYLRTVYIVVEHICISSIL